MDTQIIPASEAEGHRPPVHPEGRRVTSHESPVTPCKSFSFTHFRKNTPATPLVSHTFKTKDLKPFRFTHFQNKVGVGLPNFEFRISRFSFRASASRQWTPLRSQIRIHQTANEPARRDASPERT